MHIILHYTSLKQGHIFKVHFFLLLRHDVDGTRTHRRKKKVSLIVKSSEWSEKQKQKMHSCPISPSFIHALCNNILSLRKIHAKGKNRYSLREKWREKSLRWRKSWAHIHVQLHSLCVKMKKSFAMSMTSPHAMPYTIIAFFLCQTSSHYNSIVPLLVLLFYASSCDSDNDDDHIFMRK